jgi:hypothetical protein
MPELLILTTLLFPLLENALCSFETTVSSLGTEAIITELQVFVMIPVRQALLVGSRMSDLISLTSFVAFVHHAH